MNGLLEETGAGAALPEGDGDVAGGDVSQSRGILVGILGTEQKSRREHSDSSGHISTAGVVQNLYPHFKEV